MNNKSFNSDYPVVIGMYGKAATGKTSVANQFVPDAVLTKGYLQWDNLTFAAPLYEMVSVIRQIEGDGRRDRVHYAIHEILVDLFSRSPLYGAPKYNDLVALVGEIYSTPVGDGKPRDFMQHVGTLCRTFDEDCFVKTMKRKIMSGQSLVDADTLYCVIIDDVRLENEAELIANLPNGIVIELTASDEVRSQRMYERDGVHMTEEQASHISETAVIPREFITATIDTNSLSIAEVADHVRKYMYESIGGLLDAENVE